MKPMIEKTVDLLNIEVFENRKKMGIKAGVVAADCIRQLLTKQDNVRVIFAAAPSQNEMLEQLCKEEGIDWSRITAFHMDEYIGLPQDSPQNFSHYLTENLFRHVKPGRIHLINSDNEGEAECKRYADLIHEAPIDLICLGIGENGHIAFNDPSVADFNDTQFVKVVGLEAACRTQQVNDGCFVSLEDVPTYAITLTIPAIMSAKTLICSVPGASKREAVGNVINGPISLSCPASILRTHPHCILYTDQEAYGLS